MDDDIKREVSKRRTFAIISHPDAGKTTLTEKLLLCGGAIRLAGSVKGSRGRQTTSDWMELERQRGISISTSVLQFEYGGRRLNLLDTPGHNDFSEDTYRTLAAADSAVMLIDSVKGVEPQTIKLFQVCRMRGVPITTFINKMDRLGRPPLELLDEIEKVLGIPCTPANWPIGSGPGFLGVYDRERREVLRFERAEGGGERMAPVWTCDLDDPALRAGLGERGHEELLHEIALLETAGTPFDNEKYLAGELSPVFFGSAMTNFGLEPFLDRFVELAPSPRPRQSSDGPIGPDSDRFSGFVFKIQANMDPNHRDRVAFVRVCSGRFARGMEVNHVRAERPFTMSRTMQFLAQERITIDEAYAGDIIGVWDGGNLRIGDTLAEQGSFEFAGVPRFSPEHFVQVTLTDPLKRKQLKKGLQQLSEEGAIQLFFDRHRLERDPILGAVGVLQFEVIAHRLESEYKVPIHLRPLPYKYARWIEGEPFSPEAIERGRGANCVLDAESRPIVLFENDWALRKAIEDHPKLRFLAAVQPARGGSASGTGRRRSASTAE
jgi:peptide chain release factor 3